MCVGLKSQYCLYGMALEMDCEKIGEVVVVGLALVVPCCCSIIGDEQLAGNPIVLLGPSALLV